MASYDTDLKKRNSERLRTVNHFQKIYVRGKSGEGAAVKYYVLAFVSLGELNNVTKNREDNLMFC
jgi:hypothetical protein